MARQVQLSDKSERGSGAFFSCKGCLFFQGRAVCFSCRPTYCTLQSPFRGSEGHRRAARDGDRHCFVVICTYMAFCRRAQDQSCIVPRFRTRPTPQVSRCVQMLDCGLNFGVVTHEAFCNATVPRTEKKRDGALRTPVTVHTTIPERRPVSGQEFLRYMHGEGPRFIVHWAAAREETEATEN